MKKVMFGALLSTLLTTASFAGENRSGVYLGLGLGTSTYTDSGLSKVMGLGELENNDNTVKFYGGYQFNNVVGIEIGYTDYGKNVQKVNTRNYSYSVKSYSIAANLGYSFLDSQIRPFVNLGLAYVSTTHENLPYNYINLSDGAGAFHYGLGIQYEPNILKGLGFRLAYEADLYATSIDYGDGISTSNTYTQINSTIYAGIQYKF